VVHLVDAYGERGVRDSSLEFVKALAGRDYKITDLFRQLLDHLFDVVHALLGSNLLV
jgi:hypothetical protein